MSKHDFHEQRSSDYGALLSLAFRTIKEKCKNPAALEGMTKTAVRSMDRTYKVEWLDPESGHMVTLYDDGVWTMEGEGIESEEGRVRPLHYRYWADRLVKLGGVAGHGGMAKCAVEYFKDLKKKR